jgi:hypothetical protein
MRTVTALINPTVNQIHDRPVEQLSEQAAWTINDIFKSLQASFPAWKHAFPSDKELNLAKKVWTKGLMESGITSLIEIKLGMRQARASDSDFFPSVGKFIGWCKPTPEAFGLPANQAAYTEACNLAHLASRGNWTHPAVYHAASQTGFFNLKQSTPGDATNKQFDHNYTITIRKVMAGDDFESPIATAIEQQARIPTEQELQQNHEAGDNALSALKGLFG